MLFFYRIIRRISNRSTKNRDLCSDTRATDLPCDIILCIASQLGNKKDIVNYFSVLGSKFGKPELDEVARRLEVPYADKIEKLIEYSSMNIGSLVPEFLRQDDIRILRFQCGVNLFGLPTQYPRVAREVFSIVQKYEQFRRDIFRNIILKKNFGMLKFVLEQENIGDLLGTLVSTLSHKLEELSFLILEDV